MAPTPPSWSRRFLNVTPPMPDGVFVGFIVLMVFLVGICAGVIWCGSQDVQHLSVQQQLNLLDQRLKALESR